MKKHFLAVILSFQIFSAHADEADKYISDATFWSKRLNNSVVYQFLFNDAIQGGITDAEYSQLESAYIEEAKSAEITLDAYKQVLLLKNETDNDEFKRFIADLTSDNKLTHYEVDLIIKKHQSITKGITK